MSFESNNINNANNCIVIGGGISGLAAAWKLGLSGFNVTVIERQKILGGLAASINYNGFIVDIGPHYISLPLNSTFLHEIQNLMGRQNILELSNIKNVSKIYYQKKIQNEFPNLSTFIFGSPKSFQLRVVLELFTSRFMIHNKHSSVSEKYLISNYGKLLYNTYFKPYIFERFGHLDPPLDLIQQTIPPLNLKKIFSSIKNKNSITKNKKIESKTYVNLYFKEGMGSLIENLKKEIEKNGGKIILDANIKTISHEKNKIVTYVSDGKKYKISSDIIIYSISLPNTLQWFDQNHKDLNKKKSFHGIFIFLFVNMPLIFNSWMIRIFDPDIPFFRLSQQNFLSNKISPFGKSVLCVEIRCLENDELWKKSEAELIHAITKHLTDMKILQKDKIEDYKIMKFRYLYPKEELLTYLKYDELENYINSFTNEYALGSIEIDGGRLTSQNSMVTEHYVDPSAGGIYMALINSARLVEKIRNKSDKTIRNA